MQPLRHPAVMGTRPAAVRAETVATVRALRRGASGGLSIRGVRRSADRLTIAIYVGAVADYGIRFSIS